MGKTSFQSLDQLTKKISEQIVLLNVGQLNASEIEELTQSSQDLYERLIVIRHKAYEKLGTPSTEKIIEVPIEKKETEPIQEVKKVEEESIFDFSTETKIKEKEPEMMSFDFSEPVTETPSVVEAIKEDAPVVEEPIVTKTIEPQDSSASLNDSHSGSSSLNDSFSENKSGSLADSFNKSGISDLKTHIGINKKFSFISNLFAGSNENYNDAINTLNNCLDGDQARSILGDIAQKNNWNVEDDTVVTFVDLVERRYS
jgi:hypothetical protein